MINQDRIVPVTKTDLLSLYSVIAGIQLSINEHVFKLEATEMGVFATPDFQSDGVTCIANEPLKSCDIRTSASFNLFFIPDYDYEGFIYDGGFVEVVGDTVQAGDTALYCLLANDGLFTIKKYGL